MTYLQLFLAAPWVVRAVGTVLALFAVLFVALFLVPGLVAWFRYDNLVLRIRAFKRARGNNPATLFAGDKRLAHVWAEYEKTLHRQREPDPVTGELAVVALRATVPAGSIFTQEALVDSRLRTEFFKHLPGLCTGIGIIGTFAGLIDGLRAFHVADDPTIVRSSLEFLLHGVFQAFLVSAAAITLAMLVTLIERFFVATLYRKVEAITFELDSSFEAGVGEMYLERLVNASEQSADRATALKAALVNDVKAALADVSERQIRAQAQAHQELARLLAETLRAELIEPIWRIATTLDGKPREESASVPASDPAAGQRLGEAAATIQAAAAELARSTQMLGALLRDQAGSRDTLAATLEKLRTSIESGPAAAASHPPALAAPGQPAVDVEEFLDGVGTILARSHEAFASAVQRTVDTIYDDFYRKLSNATQLLAEGVAELASALDHPERRP